jgi:hypothetical protein
MHVMMFRRVLQLLLIALYIPKEMFLLLQMEARMKISGNALLNMIQVDFYSIPFPILRDELLILGKRILRVKLERKSIFQSIAQ